MPEVEVFTIAGCPACADLISRLDQAGIPHTAISGDTVDGGAELMMRGGDLSFPQVYVDGERTDPGRLLAHGKPGEGEINAS